MCFEFQFGISAQSFPTKMYLFQFISPPNSCACNKKKLSPMATICPTDQHVIIHDFVNLEIIARELGQLGLVSPRGHTIENI